MSIKGYKRIVSSILTLTFMLTIIPLNFNVRAETNNKKIERTIIKELVEQRTENSKVFLNSDGTYTAEVYNSPIHYKNEDKFEEIDNTLIKEEKQDKSGNVYKNKANKVKITMDESLENESPIALELDDYKVELKPYIKAGQSNKKGKVVFKKDKKKSNNESDNDNNRVKEENDDSIESIEYENTDKEVNLRYTPMDNGFKEEIILNSYQNQNTFEFMLNLKDLVPWKTDQGSIALKDKDTDKIKGIIEAPFMYDSSQDTKFSDNISMTIEKLKDKNTDLYKLTIKANEKFLKDKDTVYPVIIDPTTTLQGSSSVYDAYVQSKYPTMNYCTSTQLRAGYDDSTGKVRSYISFPKLPSINKGIIISAKFSAYGANSNVPSGSNAYINVHRVLGSWSASSITWNNAPSFESSHLTQTAVSNPKWYSWDITSLISNWYRGSIPNYGIVMKDSAETARYRRFESTDSTNKPKLEITYSLPPSNLTYSVGSLGTNTGKGYINLSWNSVSGAAGYKVAIFNGKSYDYFDVGTAVSWTTKGKKIWSTAAEIKNGRYILHTDGLGEDLPNDPVNTYINSKGSYQSSHNYWCRVVSYNKYGQQSDIYGNVITPTLPDSTSPNSPSGVSISLSNNPSVNTPNAWKSSVNWNLSSDLPSSMGSGISSYKIKLYVGGGTLKKEISVASNSTSTSFDNLSDCTSYYASVQAIDSKGNYSSESKSSTIITKDRTRPSTPSSVTLNKTTWTNISPITVSWSGLTDNVGITNVQYSIDNSSWVNTGSKLSSGTCIIYTDSLSEGNHTIAIRGKDAEGNESYSKSTTYYKDTVKPQNTISYPIDQQTISGTVNVKATLSDLHFSEWILEYGVGNALSSYTKIASGATAVANILT